MKNIKINNLEDLKNNKLLNQNIKKDIINKIELFKIDNFILEENLKEDYICLSIHSKESKSENYSDNFLKIKKLIEDKIEEDNDFESKYNVSIDDNNSIELYF